MIKKKLIALGVSAVAVTAVVGAGFAGWTFTTEAKYEHNLGVNVTAAYSFGTVAVDTNQPDTVVLDQSGVKLAKGNATAENVTATWTVNKTSYGDAVTAGLTYAVNVYVNTALSTYVNCGETSADTTNTRTGYTAYKFTLTPAAGDITENGDNTVVTMTLANPLKYTSSKPGTFDAYKDMVAALKGIDKSTVTTDQAYDVEVGTAAPVIIEFTVTKTKA